MKTQLELKWKIDRAFRGNTLPELKMRVPPWLEKKSNGVEIDMQKIPSTRT